MTFYRKLTLCATLCFWGVLLLAFLLLGRIPFGLYVTATLLYYGLGVAVGALSVHRFQQEWLRLFPDQGTRYDDVRWGKGKGDFLPGPFRIRAGLRQMENEMLASPDKTEETEQIVYASRNAPFVLLVDFVVFSATTCFCFFTCAFL
ncbi:MAG TPA: hypothetical protein H9810_11510 [Candidatus Gemmiger excrementavium]|uniref:Uncharacterized protein n=1 Tax=Candidatus Gemmiger excrementavium TaxID=2838608 RepID=A0A9D2F5E3_9FIRM|nr:hypothetical protein [Candidatus Gemmiger excrementavium]